MCTEISWEEIEKQIKNENNIVLLGNGFSRSYDSEIFNQQKILEDMPSLQGKNGINDIEVLIRNTKDNIMVNNQDKIADLEYIKKWVEESLRLEFISTLLEKMPKTIKNKQEYDADTLFPYRNFLSNFNEIYTLNYDPILYWMTMRLNGNVQKDIEEIANEAIKNDCKINIENKKYLDKLLNEKADIMKKLSNDDEYNIEIWKRGISVLKEKLSSKRATKLLKSDIWKEIISNIDSNQELLDKFTQQIDRVDQEAKQNINCEIEECIMAINELNIPQNDSFIKDNSTGLCIWDEEKALIQQVFYLHGAYHYFHKNGQFIKITSFDESLSDKQKDKDKEFNTTMLQQVKNLLNSGYHPLTILEPTSKAKVDKIMENDYLRHCFNSFKSLQGNLVTHGLSFDPSDSHIIQAIKENKKLDKIYIGYHTENDKRRIEEIFSDLNNVFLYCTEDFFKRLENEPQKELICAK